jgi:Glycosyl hydrolase family 47
MKSMDAISRYFRSWPFPIILLLFIVLLVVEAVPSQVSAQPADSSREFFASKVKTETQRAWLAYVRYAWGHDEVRPLSKGFRDWYPSSLFLTPIDAYGTLKIMGFQKDADRIENYVADSLSFDKDMFVKTFEVNIRVLGGLLSMYDMSHDQRILAKAEDFGKRILPAFGSKTGIPSYYVNLKTGEVRGDTVNVAEGGSYIFEMGTLSYFTKNPLYYQTAMKAERALYSRRSSLNLVSQTIDIRTGQWVDTVSHIGACIDSYYEYLYKSWLLFRDPELKQMWDTSIAAIQKYIPDDASRRLWYGVVNSQTGEKVSSTVTLWDAYFPALLALSGDTIRAEKLLASWNWLWNKNGLEPAGYNYATNQVVDSGYYLSPEIIESTYYLSHFTHDPIYLREGEEYFEDIEKYCSTDIAFCDVDNVVTKKQLDALPSYFFAETMNYFYLLFSENGDRFFDEHIFSTESHPIRRDDFSPEQAKIRLGF